MFARGGLHDQTLSIEAQNEEFLLSLLFLFSCALCLFFDKQIEEHVLRRINQISVF